MNIPALSYVLWAVSVLAHVSVFLILSVKKLSHTRVLKMYMAFEALHSMTLFVISRYCTHLVYAYAYSLLGVLSFAFQLTILFELARGTMRPLGNIIKTRNVVVSLTLAVFVMGLFSFILNAHSNQSTILVFWEDRVSVFVSGMMCVVIFAVFVVMNRFYMAFRRHTFAIAQGLFVWHYSLLFQDAFHAGQFTSWYTGFDYFVEFLYLAVLVYWSFVFWKGEELPPSVPKELLSRVLAAYGIVEDEAGLEDTCK